MDKHYLKHNKKIYITKQLIFDAAHHLYDYLGPCANVHGHTYKLEVTFEGYTNQMGLVTDFKKLKEFLELNITGILDHQDINEVLSNINPTAENIIWWMWDTIQKNIHEISDEISKIRLYKIKLYETPTSYVEFRGED